MEQIVKDGKAAFSLTESGGKEVSWLSMIDNDDVNLIHQYLEQSENSRTVPKTISGLDTSYYTDRYMAAIEWIDQYDHAKIGHGSFYLSLYNDEGGVAFREFKNASYLYEVGRWSHFVEPTYPHITSVGFDGTVSNKSFTVDVHSTGTGRLRYFLTHEGEIIHADEITCKGTDCIIMPLDEQWTCPASLLFVVSDNVIIPDVCSTDVVGASVVILQ